jgi:uncharacterized RDD family membrane protein YckC
MAVAAAASVAGTGKAGFWRRTFAYLIDGVAVGIVLQILNSFLISSAGSADEIVAAASRAAAVNIVIGVAYFVGLWTYWGGQTLGMKALGIKVVKTDGSALTIGTSIIRYVGLVISFAVLFIGVIWVAFDANKQGWHDKMANTYVVRV